jgi:hypothetical protein
LNLATCADSFEDMVRLSIGKAQVFVPHYPGLYYGSCIYTVDINSEVFEILDVLAIGKALH